MTGRQLCRVKLSHPDGVAGRRSVAALLCRATFGHSNCFRATFGHVGRLRATFGHSRALFRPNPARERWPCPNPAREWQNVRRASESCPTTQAMPQFGPGVAGTPGSSESRPKARGDLNRPMTLTAHDVWRSWRIGAVRLHVYIRFVSSPGKRRIFLSACRGRLIPVKGTMGAGVFGRKVRL